MQKQDIINFFDQHAPNWDAEMVRNEAVIASILDIAGITQGVSVLDVACGTGVVIPDYLNRGASHVTGVDISPAMIAIAQDKFCQPDVTLLCADVETATLDRQFDCCVVYNAFPHFAQPERLICALAGHLKPGGRLTVAHGRSREAINRHHSGAASKVSVGLLHETELCALFAPYFVVDTAISTDEKYVVSGYKK